MPPPKPWTNRPATNTSIVGASPATTSPAAKAATPVQSGAIGPLTSLHLPLSTVAITPAAIAPLNASPYSAYPSSSRATTGMAVATARYSKATRERKATIPTVSAR